MSKCKRFLLVVTVLSIPSLVSADDYGVVANLIEGVSGCTNPWEGKLEIKNENKGVTVRVGWWGEYSGDNLLFRNSEAGYEDLDECPPQDWLCEQACPSPDPDSNCSTVDGGCDFIACCKECACEIANGSGFEIAYLGQPGGGICSLPGCDSSGGTCDNTPTNCSNQTNLFCVTLIGDPGAHVELEDVSFDGTCFISVDEPISVDPLNQCS
jgi:hypothetical protein